MLKNPKKKLLFLKAHIFPRFSIDFCDFRMFVLIFDRCCSLDLITVASEARLLSDFFISELSESKVFFCFLTSVTNISPFFCRSLSAVIITDKFEPKFSCNKRIERCDPIVCGNWLSLIIDNVGVPKSTLVCQ